MLGLIFQDISYISSLVLGLGSIPFAAKWAFRENDFNIDVMKAACLGGLAYSFVLTGEYYVLYASSTDLVHSEYLNGEVKSLEYYEAWTEEYEVCTTTCDDDDDCTTTCRDETTRHSPYWVLNHTIGSGYSISKMNFEDAKSKYGAKEYNLSHHGQISVGDGNKWVVFPTDVVPVTISHSYMNYIKAAKLNVLNEQINEEDIVSYKSSGYLLPYPTRSKMKFGNYTINRVLDATQKINIGKMKKQLDLYSAEIGRPKQVNPIIYITNQDSSFPHYLNAYWEGGNKNDAILILGIDDNKTITWSDTIALTEDMDYFSRCRNDFEGMSLDSENLEIARLFKDIIYKDYERRLMESFYYLTTNIGIEPFKCLLLFLFNLMFGSLFAYYIRNN